MQFIVNEQNVIIEKPEIFIPDLLHHQSINDVNGLAIAINNQIVSREQWQTTTIKENDKILIIRATQGG